jgi:hypothetical protein
MTGQIDPELSASIGAEQHGALFAGLGVDAARYPSLSRIRDFYADADYKPEELKALIAEIEHAASLFPVDGEVRRFLGPFQLVCCSAFFKGKGVALYAD